MTVDRLQLHVPGTDPAAQRRPCGCRGDGRGAHQLGCTLRGVVAFRAASHRWLSREGRWLRHVLGVTDAEALDVMREGSAEP